MRKSLVVVAAVASLVVSPAFAQAQEAQYATPENGGATDDPYGYPSGPYPSEDPAPCQYDEFDCEGPYQYLSPDGPSNDMDAIMAEDATQAGAAGSSSAPVKAAAGDPEDAETFRSAIEAARADRAGGTPPAGASEPDGDVAVIEGAAPVGGYVGDAAGDAEEVQEVAAPVVEEVQEVAAPVVEEGGRRAVAVARERPPEERDAARDAADEAGGANGGNGGSEGAGSDGVALEASLGSDGALPIALLGGGSAFLVGTGLVLRRAIR